jgi:NADPH2:quinone reductase
MKAVVVTEFGPFQNAAIQDLASPKPGPGEVVVDLHAIEVNYPDILVMEGNYQVKPPLPFSPGKAGAGVISATGEGVSMFKVGDHVSLQAEYGTYAEQITACSGNCHLMPSNMPFDVGAALGLVYQTAHFALIDRAAMISGETVLVLGASGGVGAASVQLARALGAGNVIGGVKSMNNAELAKAAGCADVIDLGMDNLRDGLRDRVRAITGGQGVDIVIDPVGGAVTDAALRALAWRGRLVVVGFAAGEIPTIRTNYLLVKNISVSGLQWSDYRERDPAWVQTVQQEIFDLWSEGKLSPQIAATLPMAQFAEALTRLKAGEAHGKIILTT